MKNYTIDPLIPGPADFMILISNRHKTRTGVLITRIVELTQLLVITGLTCCQLITFYLCYFHR